MTHESTVGLVTKVVVPTGVVMGLRPTQGDENGFCSATALHGGVALPFVIPTEPRSSYCAAPSMATRAAFLEESRVKLVSATKPDGTVLDETSAKALVEFTIGVSAIGDTPIG